MLSASDSELFLFAEDSVSEMIETIERLEERSSTTRAEQISHLAAEITQGAGYSSGILRIAMLITSLEELQLRLKELKSFLQNTPLDDETLIHIQPGLSLSYGLQPLKVGFIFPGQGSQQLNMAWKCIQRYEWAKELVDLADACLLEHGFAAISPVLFPSLKIEEQGQKNDYKNQLNQTVYAQVAVALISFIYAEFIQRLGVQPSVTAGHSLGELSALAIAGTMDIETLIRLSAERAQAMAERPENVASGSMLSLLCTQKEAEEIILQVPGYLTLACLNSFANVVLSGESQAIKEALEIAEEREIKSKSLTVANAFHSRLMAHAAERLRSVEWIDQELQLSIPFISALDGQIIQDKLDIVEYCAAQVMAPIHFTEVIKRIREHCELLIEVGPGKVLTSFINDERDFQSLPVFPVESLAGMEKDLYRVVGTLFVSGHTLHTEMLYTSEPFASASEEQIEKSSQELVVSENTEDHQTDTSYESEETLTIKESDHSLTLLHLPGISKEQLARYLQERGDFISQVIRADIESHLLKEKYAGL